MLGRLIEVELRSHWVHERDFTRWLYKQENLNILGKELGIEMDIITDEAQVGKYSLDILAKIRDNGDRVVIENQIEDSDHDHLGKLITYASGLNAKYIIWIVKNLNDEHRVAIEWLNDHSDENLYFYVAKIELYAIDNSSKAPKFQVLVKPNEWSKEVKATTISDSNSLYHEFWIKYRDYCIEKGINLNLGKAPKNNYYSVSYGEQTITRISVSLGKKRKVMWCHLWFPKPINNEFFNKLYDRKEVIAKRIKNLIWDSDLASSSFGVRVEDQIDIDDKNKWNNYFEWMSKNAILFQDVFSQYNNI